MLEKKDAQFVTAIYLIALHKISKFEYTPTLIGVEAYHSLTPDYFTRETLKIEFSEKFNIWQVKIQFSTSVSTTQFVNAPFIFVFKQNGNLFVIGEPEAPVLFSVNNQIQNFSESSTLEAELLTRVAKIPCTYKDLTIE